MVTMVTFPASGQLQPDRISWQELHFRASKFFITADAEVSLERLDEEVLLILGSEVLGRRSETRVWLDAETAAVRREESRKIHDKADLRTYTYAADHAIKVRYHERPEEAGDQPVSTWVEKSRERQDYLPPPSTAGAKSSPSSVTTPPALLYLLAASSLAKVGDTVETTIFADERLVTARAEVVELVAFKYDIDLVEGDQAPRAYRPQGALRLRLTGRDAKGGKVDLGLIGLEGDLEIVLDADRRMPLTIKGSLPVVGRLEVRLRSAVVAAPPSTKPAADSTAIPAANSAADPDS